MCTCKNDMIINIHKELVCAIGTNNPELTIREIWDMVEKNKARVMEIIHNAIVDCADGITEEQN